MTVRTLASFAWTWAIVALPLAAPLAAQRGAARRELPRPSREASGGDRRAQAIRAEYAAVLLQSGQYRAAAEEYRTLLASEPRHADYRFALARALAWGGQSREAERELLALRSQRPNDPQVAALLRTTRESYEPTAKEAEQWVAEDASFAPYRLAFARALAREGDLPRGLAQYDTLLASRGGSASLWLERAQVNVARGDLGAAESDVQSSIFATPTADAFVLLGDLARWRGQYATARSWYERAGGLQPDSRAVRAAFARLARDEHPALAFAPIEGSSEGWRADASAISDNLGVRYTTVGAHRGTVLAGGITASAGVEYRRLSENSSLRNVALDGYAADVAASREAQVGVLYGRVGTHGGFVSHPGLGAFPEGSVSLAGWYGAWGLGLDLRSALAYPSLLTLESLRPSQLQTGSSSTFVVDQPLREQSTTASIAGPLARTDLALVAQRSHLSDGNVRTTVQLYARHPLAPRLAMIYAGSVIGFSDRSPLYWDPLSYVSNATGLEYAVRRARGFTYALSVLPGLASAEESLSGSVPRDMPREMRRSAAQLSGAADASYRSESWEAGAAMSYNRGRAGSYERMGARLYLRLTP